VDENKAMVLDVSTGTRRWLLGAVLFFAFMSAVPAGAQVPVVPVELPTLLPTSLPTLEPIDVPTDVPDPDDVVSEIEPGTSPTSTPTPDAVVDPSPDARTGSGTHLTRPTSTTGTTPTVVGSNEVDGVPSGAVVGGYGTVTGSELRKAAGRALHLAGPLAAPLVLAIVLLGIVAVMSRGADKLVRADAGAKRRVYRL
jgi:hypothetical protein